jgi:hypothetical protein
MNNNDKSVWDGVILVASYHFLMAVVCLLGSAATVVFAIIPNLSTATGSPHSIFLPVIGGIFGLILSIWYASIGSGLIRLKNSSRMGAVFLALFGSIGGLFVLLGAGIPVINGLLPDVGAVTGVAVASICFYSLMTFLDIIVLVFLYSGRVRAVLWRTVDTGKCQRSRHRLCCPRRYTWCSHECRAHDPIRPGDPRHAGASSTRAHCFGSHTTAGPCSSRTADHSSGG